MPVTAVISCITKTIQRQVAHEVSVIIRVGHNLIVFYGEEQNVAKVNLSFVSDLEGNLFLVIDCNGAHDKDHGLAGARTVIKGNDHIAVIREVEQPRGFFGLRIGFA